MAYLFDEGFDRVHQLTWGAGGDAPIAVDGSASIGFLPDGNVAQHWGLDAASQGWGTLAPTPGTANSQ